VGLRFEKRDYDGEAPVVVEVHSGSLAELAGIRAGDRIEAINGRSQINALHTAKALREAEGEIKILISRRADIAAESADMAVPLGKPRAPQSYQPHDEEMLRFTKRDGESVGLRFSSEQSSSSSGILVEDVREGSLADHAGIRAGDLIRSINGQRDLYDSANAARMLRAATGAIEIGRLARADAARSARAHGAGGMSLTTGASAGAKPAEPPAAVPPPAPSAPAAAAPAAPEDGFFTGLVRALSFTRSLAAAPKSAQPAPALQSLSAEPAAAQQPAQQPAAAGAAAGAPRARRPSWTDQLAANLADFNLFDLGAKERREREAKEARAREEARAATRLQSAARGRAARNEYRRSREAAIDLQAGARGQQSRHEARRLRNAASRAQAGWRGRNARVEARKRRAAKAAPSGGLVRRMSFGRPAAGGSARNSASGGGGGGVAKPGLAPTASSNGSTPRESVVGGLVRRLSFNRKKQ
jgi:hypothetical protein